MPRHLRAASVTPRPRARLLDVPALGLPTVPKCPGRLAEHEAGHAVVAAALGLEVASVSLEEWGGQVIIGKQTESAPRLGKASGARPTDSDPPPLCAEAQEIGAYFLLSRHIECGECLAAGIAWMATAVAGLAGERIGTPAAMRADFDHRRAQTIAGALYGMVTVPLIAIRLAAYVLEQNRTLHAQIATQLRRQGACEPGLLQDVRGDGSAVVHEAAEYAATWVHPDAVSNRMIGLLKTAVRNLKFPATPADFRAAPARRYGPSSRAGWRRTEIFTRG